MTQQNPSPRAAVTEFIGATFPSTLLSLMQQFATSGTRWDGEDSILAFKYHTVANRQAWLDLEAALASKVDPEAALAAAELLMSGSAPGGDPLPTMGTEADVQALWTVHLLTAPVRRVRVRALSRLVSGSEFPDDALASLSAAVAGLP